MDKATCSIDGCARPSRLAGMCGMHHQRKVRHGDPHYTPPVVTVEERFWSKVDVGHPLGCWIWTAATRRGYGTLRVNGKPMFAHRWAYQHLRGVELSQDEHIDHLCRNPPCVNPDHLEPVDLVENALHRGYGPASKNAAKTHCDRGHPFDDENTYHRRDGARGCRTCERDRKREAAARARTSKPPMNDTEAAIMGRFRDVDRASAAEIHEACPQLSRAMVNSAVVRVRNRGWIEQVDKVGRTPYYAITDEGRTRRRSMDEHLGDVLVRAIV